MSTLQTRLSDLATRISTECKSLRTLINGNAADNSALITTAKANLVVAINEVKSQANAIQAANYAVINDTATSGPSVTYSIDKINATLATLQTTIQNNIIGGASAAYDTLKELQDAITNDMSAISAINSALANRVRTDVATQGLTSAQQQNARTNIGALSTVEIGNPDTNLVSAFESGLT